MSRIIEFVLVVLDEDANKKEYLFYTENVGLSTGEHVVVNTRKGIKTGIITETGTFIENSPEVRMIWSMNKGRNIKPVVCLYEDLSIPEPIRLKDVLGETR